MFFLIEVMVMANRLFRRYFTPIISDSHFVVTMFSLIHRTLSAHIGAGLLIFGVCRQWGNSDALP